MCHMNGTQGAPNEAFFREIESAPPCFLPLSSFRSDVGDSSARGMGIKAKHVPGAICWRPCSLRQGLEGARSSIFRGVGALCPLPATAG